MRKYILIVVLVVATSLSAVNAQTSDSLIVKHKVECESSLIHFRFDKSVLDPQYMNNAVSLKELDRILTDKSTDIDSVVITASSSPDGVVEHNQALASRRAKTMKGYIIRKYPHINQHSICAKSVGENWQWLQQLVEADSKVPYKKQILKILSQNINPATKEWRLKQVGGGKAWSYITKHFLRNLRAATTCVVYYTNQETEKAIENSVEKSIERPIEKPIEPPLLIQQEINPIITEAPIIIKQAVGQPIASPQVETFKKPFIALKTNLLADAAITPNLELEIPVGKRWSINIDYQYGWWLRKDNTFCWQIESGGIEGRYWFGDREKRNVLTGWFVGMAANLGMYDFQLKSDRGSRGEFYTAGFTGGYVTPIARNLNLEFSMGVGYLISVYKDYKVVDNAELIRIKSDRFQSILPTKAKISLVWMINRNTKKGGTR